MEAAAGEKPVLMMQGVYLITPLVEGDSPKTMVTYSPLMQPDADPSNQIYMCLPNEFPNIMAVEGSSAIVDSSHAGEKLIEGLISRGTNGEISVTDPTTNLTESHWCEVRDGTREHIEQQLQQQLNNQNVQTS